MTLTEHRATHAPPEEHGSHHLIPTSVYYKVFAALMVGLFLTVWAANIHFGSPKINVLIAVTIAVAKAVLIILYFMHVRFSTRLVQFFVAGTYLWLMILFTLTMVDYMSRVGVTVLGGG